MIIQIVDPEDERRSVILGGLRAAGHDVQAFAEPPFAEPPSAEPPGEPSPSLLDVLIVAGPCVTELAIRHRRDRSAHWILALTSMEEAPGALAAGANDCLTEAPTLDAICLRILVAQTSGALAPTMGAEEQDYADPDKLDALLPEVTGRQLRAIFELLPLPVGIVDATGCFVQCNRALERAFHQAPGSVVGRGLPEFFRSAEVAAILEGIQRTGLVQDQELQLLDSDGHEYWVAGTARWITSGEGYVIGSFLDITERRRTSEALRNSESSLRAVLEASPDGILIHAQGRYLFVNQTVVEQLGHETRESLLAVSIYDHLHPDDVTGVEDRVRAMALSGEPAEVRDIEFVRLDGEPFVGEVASVPVIFDGVPAIISQIRDASERRRMQSQLFLADRLATVGTLAVGVAHEINNPLSWVIGNLGLLADELDNQVRMRDDPNHVPAQVLASRSRIRRLLRRTQEGTERVRRIVRDLGRLARPDAGEDEVVDVHALLDSTMEIADVQIRQRARLERDFGAHGLVFGAEARMGQVFLNLLVNAGQAITAGAPRENWVRVTTRDLPDGRVEIEIADTGTGISPVHLGRIFDPFFTTKVAGEGTGIGLAISQTIVAELGGEITVESEVGKGTRFFVRLRRAEVGSDSAASTSDGTSETQGDARARILVVDDEPLIREMVADALARHEVETVARGLLALERIVDEDWDLILCDVIIPELTGIELWHRLRELRPDALDKLVFMTGGDFPGGGGKFPEGAKIRRLEKPFSIRALRALAERAAESSRS